MPFFFGCSRVLRDGSTAFAGPMMERNLAGRKVGCHSGAVDSESIALGKVSATELLCQRELRFAGCRRRCRLRICLRSERRSRGWACTPP